MPTVRFDGYQNKKARIALIHVAKNQLHLDDNAYSGILAGAGLASAADMTSDEQFAVIMNAFAVLGFKSYARQNGVKYKAVAAGESREHISKRQEYYIRGLWDMASRAKDEKSLRAMIKRIGKVDDIRFLTRKAASSLILALRDICWKAGFNPDTKEAVR
jgi:hypothetical protein